MAEADLQLTEAERKLVLRLRGLTPGRHLVILDIDRAGLDTVTLVGAGKKESLRPQVTEIVQADQSTGV